MASAVIIGEIAGELAMALLNGALGKFGQEAGAKIFNHIFGKRSGTPDYFDDVYKTIKQIVQNELEQDTIDALNGEIKGIKDWVINIYNPRKDSGAGKNELYNMIQENPAYDMAVHMLAVLQQGRCAELGLGVFMIGAGMHLTLLQELALVDSLVSHPSKSSYVVSVARYADEYAAFVDATYYSIETKRIQAMDAKDAKSPECVQRVMDDLAKSLHDPIQVATIWRTLIHQPLPSHI